MTAAAAVEHVAQPWISKQLQLLERELGVPLFHRVGRRVVATDAALQLADCADRVLDDLAATTLALAGTDQRPAAACGYAPPRRWSISCYRRRSVVCGASYRPRLSEWRCWVRRRS